MTTHSSPLAGLHQDDEETAIATPEGDNEGLPSQPLSPNEPTPLRPPGDEPHSTEPVRKALG
ncbi:MAG: hypothetical protein HIU91_06565 [Acidobacteria bacterium]|nr:hypothetical protein [Acidobacteriota bacterium]